MIRVLRSVSLCMLILGLGSGQLLLAHSPTMDCSAGNTDCLTDWCIGAFSNTAPAGGRTEDSGVVLTCGRCSGASDPDLACVNNGDCPGGQTCVAPGSKTEVAWWDDRKDGAVNDLATIAITLDDDFIYFGAELWVDPDPVSLPFGQIALDIMPGGKDEWHDPLGNLKAPGHCSGFTDRACAKDINDPSPLADNEDCDFCMISTEPLGDRVRTCGSGCDPDIGDTCDTSQTCVNIGASATKGLGVETNPVAGADYLVLFDFGRWLQGLTGPTLLMKNVGGTWTPAGTFEPAVNPGASGGSGGPPGAVEQAIPLAAFGGDLVNGQDFTYTMIIARGDFSADFLPDGPIEDLMTEKVAGTTTATGDSCCDSGIATTSCELADGSADAFIPRAPNTPGGRSACLTLDRGAGSDITLEWCPSCSELDNDYAVYEGEIGNWYSHVQITGQCSTGGATTTSFSAAPGNLYYLVAPSNDTAEGSYGADSDGAERPTATPGCKTQALGNCP